MQATAIKYTSRISPNTPKGFDAITSLPDSELTPENIADLLTRIDIKRKYAIETLDYLVRAELLSRPQVESIVSQLDPTSEPHIDLLETFLNQHRRWVKPCLENLINQANFNTEEGALFLDLLWKNDCIDRTNSARIFDRIDVNSAEGNSLLISFSHEKLITPELAFKIAEDARLDNPYGSEALDMAFETEFTRPMLMTVIRNLTPDIKVDAITGFLDSLELNRDEFTSKHRALLFERTGIVYFAEVGSGARAYAYRRNVPEGKLVIRAGCVKFSGDDPIEKIKENITGEPPPQWGRPSAEDLKGWRVSVHRMLQEIQRFLPPSNIPISAVTRPGASRPTELIGALTR